MQLRELPTGQAERPRPSSAVNTSLISEGGGGRAWRSSSLISPQWRRGQSFARLVTARVGDLARERPAAAALAERE